MNNNEKCLLKKQPENLDKKYMFSTNHLARALGCKSTTQQYGGEHT